MDTLTILILALAVFRLTRLFYNEAGPFDVVGKFRKLIGVVYDERSNRIANNEIAEIFNCPHCLGMWLSFAVWGSYWMCPNSLMWFYAPLALSAINSLLYLRFGNG